MKSRRLIYLCLLLLCFAGLTALMVLTLAPGGFSILKAILLASFLLTLPWTIIGFLNAVIGLAVMRLSEDPAGYVCPIRPGDASEPVKSSTAILSCVRNEDTDQLELNLTAILDGLVRSGQAHGFSFYLLSDSFDLEIAEAEVELAARLKRRFHGQIEVHYRRRQNNRGFKAGNIEDFCERWGTGHDFALVLDADSYMSAGTILDLVRRMEANPQLGILQSLVTGLPTDSAFARVFQYGMRLGMRSYTIGSAWWQGDCGPYWGHNAVIRLEPFMQHCALPEIPGKGPLSGDILSHDQVEAVLMRRAGYEVRVLPEQSGSYEGNPPHLLEFIRRDLRWCQGNLQYPRLLGLKGLKPISRAQLFLAILMFVASPAWLAFMIAAAVQGFVADGSSLRTDTGIALFISIMTMVFAPKLATVADILLRRETRRQFGGPIRVTLSTALEIVFAAMLAPVMAIAHTLFIGGLFFGKASGWGAQARGVARLPFRLTLSKLWPQTLFGIAAMVWLATQPLSYVWPVIPIAVGPFAAIALAMITSTRSAGRAAMRSTLWQVPEERPGQHPELAEINLPALAGKVDRPEAATTAPSSAEAEPA